MMKGEDKLYLDVDLRGGVGVASSMISFSLKTFQHFLDI